MRVFLTGAGGFIAGALARRLAEAGIEVTGVDLVADRTRGTVAGDVREEGAWQHAAAGADVVVHLAASLSASLRDPAGSWRVNALGTKHALDAAVRGGAGRFVLVSSVTVFGFDFPDGVTEEHPTRPTGLPYADAKIAAEQLALQAHAEGRVPVTVVRPGDVVGPGSGVWAVQPVRLLRARQFVVPRDGVFSPVFVDDLAEGLQLAALAPAAEGRVITLSGGVGIPNVAFFSPYAEAVGRRLVALPGPLVRRLAALPVGDPELNARSAAYLDRRGTYSIARAEELLGWRPRTPLLKTQRRTLAWLRESGLI